MTTNVVFSNCMFGVVTKFLHWASLTLCTSAVFRPGTDRKIWQNFHALIYACTFKRDKAYNTIGRCLWQPTRLRDMLPGFESHVLELKTTFRACSFVEFPAILVPIICKNPNPIPCSLQNSLFCWGFQNSRFPRFLGFSEFLKAKKVTPPW